MYWTLLRPLVNIIGPYSKSPKVASSVHAAAVRRNIAQTAVQPPSTGITAPVT